MSCIIFSSMDLCIHRPKRRSLYLQLIHSWFVNLGSVLLSLAIWIIELFSCVMWLMLIYVSGIWRVIFEGLVGDNSWNGWGQNVVLRVFLSMVWKSRLWTSIGFFMAYFSLVVEVFGHNQLRGTDIWLFEALWAMYDNIVESEIKEPI